MEYKYNTLKEINTYLETNCPKNYNLENSLNILFDERSEYSIYSKIFPERTNPIEIYLYELGNKPHNSMDEVNTGKGTWYQSESGYGARVCLSLISQESDKIFFKQVKTKIKNYSGVGVNLWYSGQYNILWFTEGKIFRYEPFRDPGSFHQRNIDAALMSYFFENMPSFEYYPHKYKNYSFSKNLLRSTALSSSYCIIYFQKMIEKKYNNHFNVVNQINSRTEEETINSLKNLWYSMMQK
jgi:hypothetical protein